MNKKLLCVLLLPLSITGCTTSKVARLHTTSTNISSSLDKYSKLTDDAIEFNRILLLDRQQALLSNGLITTTSPLASSPNSKFNTGYAVIYKNQIRNEAFKQQNINLMLYFKQLPLILEDKKADISGLVKNIDQLNQVIEKSVGKGEEIKGGLQEYESDVITKSLSSGFSYYQYKIYKKSVDKTVPVIIKALDSQRLLFRENADLGAENLNNKYYKAYTGMENAYALKYESIATGKVKDKIYSKEEMNKVNQLTREPYRLVDVENVEKSFKSVPIVMSQRYKDLCINSEQEQKANESFLKANSDHQITMTVYTQGKPNKNKKFIFDIERKYASSGEQMVCELINIMGLIEEHNFDRIDIATFEQRLNDYDQLMKYVSKAYQSKAEENKNDNKE